MRGLERMRSKPLDSAADKRTARLIVLSTEPNDRADRAAGSGADRGWQVHREVRAGNRVRERA